jgi:hypothetical protein
LEGGDTWAYDPRMGIHSAFMIDSLQSSDGWHDLDLMTGVSSTCMEGLLFQYMGDNLYIDRLIKTNPPDTAVYLFENGPDSIYYCSVGYKPSSRQYVSIGSSFEFGGVDTNLQIVVMDSIICYFEMEPVNSTTDVAAIRIIEPDSSIPPGVSVFPQVEVKNLGNSPATFTTHCSINSTSYSSQVPVSNLPPDSSLIVTFPDLWSPPGTLCTTYDIICWVEMVGDLNPCNDTTSSSTIIRNSSWVINSPYTPSTPFIDGYILSGEWADAESLDVSDISTLGCNDVWMYVKNDSSFVYFAVDARVDTIFETFDSYTLFFDDNHDSVFDPGGSEGRVRLTAYTPPWGADTTYFTSYSPCIGFESVAESLQGAANFNIFTGNVQYELRIPLNPIGSDEELNANPGDTVGFWTMVGDAYGGPGRILGWWPINANFNYGASCPDADLMGDLVLGSELVGIEETKGEVISPSNFVLFQNKPNPSLRTAEIRFGLPRDSQVNLSIYDVTGRLIVKLANESMQAGYHSISWDGRNRKGNLAGNGVYFYRLKASDFRATKKMVILR